MYKGQWHLQGDGITGFAADSDNPEPLWVELLANGESMGIALANLPMPANCGFYFPVPSALLDDDIDLQIRIANSSHILERAAEENAPAQANLTGEFYLDRGLTFSGWVVDPDNPEAKLNIYAFCEGQRIAHTVAAGRCYRPAQGDGHGFFLELPPSFADGLSHIIALRDEKGREIPGSPIRIRSFPEYAHKWLNQHKKMERPLIDLVSGIVESVEERLPGALGMVSYPAWKKAFPLPAPPPKQKIGICGPSRLLRGQQGSELKNGSDCLFLPGSAIALHNQAIAHMYAAMQTSGASMVFADAETPDNTPLFKPAWDKLAFLSHDYLGPCLLSGKFAKKFKPEMGQEERVKLILEAASSGPVAHLPMPLSITPPPVPDQAHLESVAPILQEFLPQAAVRNGRIVYTAPKPLISIIIPTRDHGELLKVCLDSLQHTSWPNLEIIIVDNGTTEENALAVIRQAAANPNIRIMDWPGVFNYAAINNVAAKTAKGELLCFLNNDTEALNPDWLTEMATLLLALDAGCVGAKLLWPNGLVQHGGVIIGTHQLAAHVGNQWWEDEPGYMNRNLIPQQYSAVTAACLLTPRSLFLQLDGFDARRFPIAFNDVDYCLRVGKLGKKVYWTPYALLRHHESASRGKDQSASARARGEKEMRIFRTMWGHFADPFYNPNLHLSAAVEPFLGLAFPPRSREARLS